MLSLYLIFQLLIIYIISVIHFFYIRIYEEDLSKKAKIKLYILCIMPIYNTFYMVYNYVYFSKYNI